MPTTNSLQQGPKKSTWQMNRDDKFINFDERETCLKVGSQYDARRRVAMRRPRVDACRNARIDLNPILAFPCDAFT